MKDFMYRAFGLLLIAAMPLASAFAQPLNFTPPYAPSENLQSSRSELISYRNAQDAMRGNKLKSENYVSLSGEWRVILRQQRGGKFSRFAAKHSSTELGESHNPAIVVANRRARHGALLK